MSQRFHSYSDKRGLPLTAASPGAVEAFERTMDAYLRFSTDLGPALESVFEADDGLFMGHVLKGAFVLLQGHGKYAHLAGEHAEKAALRTDAATPRERAHLAALKSWAARDLEGAAAIWEGILLEHPTDLLAIRLAHYAHFYSGDARRLTGSLARVRPHWTPETPDVSYVMGMEAFAREEAGDYAGAEEAGRAAIGLNPDDPWAIHAVAHVFEMQDRHGEGIEWVTGLRPHWTGCNNFKLHLVWHQGLMLLDQGRHEAALSLYDGEMFNPDSDEYLDHCNNAAFLQRLEILGVDVGGRWHPLAEKVRKRTDEHLLTFIDVHFALILAAAGDPALEDLRRSMESFESSAEDSNLPILKAIGCPLLEGIAAYREGDFRTTCARLQPLRYELWQMGGSHAQRDLFELILIDAAEKAGERQLLRALLAERLAEKPADPWTKARAAVC